MDVNAVKQFLSAIGVDPSSMSVERGYVQAPCPMAPYMHSGGVDTRPSFGVRISNSRLSYYFCFGCSPEAARLERLVHNVWLMSGAYPWEAAKILVREENYGEAREIHVEDDVWEEPEGEDPPPLPPEVLRKYPLLQGRNDFEARRCKFYLEHDRGVPVWVQNMLRVRYCSDSSAVIYPMTDFRGNIFLLRARSRKSKAMWTISPKLAGFPDMEFPKIKEVGVWFGMHLIDWGRPVMLVEGGEDLLRLIALGYFNVIASLTTSVTDTQIDSLCAGTYILGYDSDKSGKFAHRRITDRVRDALIFEADWGAVGCGDPGALESREQLAEVLNNLKHVERR